jgi:peptidoglycan/LPS O-acetylase OafA/YrhL
MFLLVISLVVLPLVVWAVRGRGSRRWQTLSRHLGNPLWWVPLVVVLFFAGVAPEIPGGPIIYYLVIFVLGLAALSHPKFAEQAERYRWPAIIGGVVFSLGLVIMGNIWPSLPEGSPGWVGLSLMSEAGTWLMLVGAMGLGKRHLDRASGTLSYLAEGSYAVYILHQTVIVVIAFYLVRLSIAHPLLWVILLVAAVIGTFTLYEVVRRIDVLRFLFGMHRKKRVPRTPERSAQT